MPPPLLFDLDAIDLERVLLTRDQVYEYLPHRYEFMQLDGILHFDRERAIGVAFRDVRMDEWWVRGHVPGRTILPGVLMLEMAAQTAAFFWRYIYDIRGFIAFGGVDDCKFREAVVPPARIYLICQQLEVRPRRVRCRTQAVVSRRLVFEATITGLPLPPGATEAAQ